MNKGKKWVFNWRRVADGSCGFKGAYGDEPVCFFFAQDGEPLDRIPDCLSQWVAVEIEAAHTKAGVPMNEEMENTFMVCAEQVAPLQQALEARGFVREDKLLEGIPI